jgi:two-component system chemotaxis sensor kinase CheA
MTTQSLPPPPAQKVALVVEDSISEAKIISAVLRARGLAVVCAVDGPDGLQKAQEIRPNVIIMDVNMPGMNGFEVVQALKRDPQLAGIPIVMLTGSNNPKSMVAGLDAGAVDYIPKDAFAMSALVRSIQHIGLF